MSWHNPGPIRIAAYTIFWILFLCAAFYALLKAIAG